MLERGQFAAFWDWFYRSRRRIEEAIGNRRDPIAEELLVEEIGHRLELVAPGLVHEIGGAPGRYEIVVSADGDRALFALVRALAEAAPATPGWRVTAFRQRAPQRTLLLGALELEPARLRALAEVRDGLFNVVVILRPPQPMPDREADMAGFLALDAALGEYDVETHVAAIDVRQLNPDQPWPAGTLPLDDLGAALDRVLGRPSRH
jgi:hypothetical protein